MQLEAGKYYKDDDGDKVYIGYIMDGFAYGHIINNEDTYIAKYQLNGVCLSHPESYIISEWKEPKPTFIIAGNIGLHIKNNIVTFIKSRFSAQDCKDEMLLNIPFCYDSSKPKGQRIKEID